MSSIKHKYKPCKGIGKAKGFEGCGGETLIRTYGLCATCYRSWLLNTNEGAEHIQNVQIKVKKQIDQANRKHRTRTKIDLMSADQYRAEMIQPKFNKIIRAIDYGQPCIATGNFGKMAAGHFVAVGSNRTLALNAHNVHIQSFESNSHKSGDTLKYIDGLKEIYGEDYYIFVDSLRQHDLIKLNKPIYETLNKKLIDYTKQVEKVKRTPIERIKERNKLNVYLGIYNEGFKEYRNNRHFL